MHRSTGATADRWRRGAAMLVSWTFALGSAVLLGLAAARMDSLAWGAVGIMSALGVATSLFSFQVDERTSVTFGPTVFMGSVALFGPLVAIWVTAVSMLLLELMRFRRSGIGAFGRVGAQVAAVVAASAVYGATGGITAPHGLEVADALRFLGMFAAHAVVTGTFDFLTADGRPGRFAKYGRWLSGKGVIVELSMLPLALLVVASYIPSEPATFPLLAVVLVILSAAGHKLWETQQTLRERVGELRTLNTVGEALTCTLRLDDLVRLVHEQTREPLEAPVLSVALYDEETKEIEFRACVADDCCISSWRTPIDDSCTSWVASHRELLSVPDMKAQGELRVTPKLAEYALGKGVEVRSWLGVPLMAGDRLTGVLSLQSGSVRAFDVATQELLETIGSQVGRVIDSARLYSELEKARGVAESWNRELEQSVRDRTKELERTQSELEGLNEDLEARVEERTRELREMQAKIVQSGRLAAVGELAAGVAHELNNPLGGILGYAQYDLEKLTEAGSDPLSSGDRERFVNHLSYIERETQRCRDIVQNLLRFSETSLCACADVDIDGLLRDTLGFTNRELSSRGIELVMDLDASRSIAGDTRQLQQVFANIILNARKAMSGGGRLSVRSRVVAGGLDGKDAVAIGFADTGCGIPEENLVRVFEPFFRTGEVGEGSGLGLSVSYGIVKDHGGDIGVESEVGVGSTFTVMLPVSETREPVTATQDAAGG
jgi:signal transduction histidine kinase